MKGQLSSCLTSSTVSSSQADSSWTPWFLPEERRLEEEEVAAGVRTGLEGFGGAVVSVEEQRGDVQRYTSVPLLLAHQGFMHLFNVSGLNLNLKPTRRKKLNCIAIVLIYEVS